MQDKYLIPMICYNTSKDKEKLRICDNFKDINYMLDILYLFTLISAAI